MLQAAPGPYVVPLAHNISEPLGSTTGHFVACNAAGLEGALEARLPGATEVSGLAEGRSGQGGDRRKMSYEPGNVVEGETLLRLKVRPDRLERGV